jgi:5-methylcytosine-specific restriction endonuclease McrA
MNARELSNRLAELLRKERQALAEFLVALADFDRERRWADLGHSSLFSYLHRDLGLSKGAAFYRMTAAQLIQRHREVVEPLRDGRLCLTSMVELSKVLTAENLTEVLPRFFHLSKREAQDVLAELNPTPAPTRTVVTAVRVPAPSTALALDSASAIQAAPLISVSWPDEPAHANSGRPTQEGLSPMVKAPPAPMTVEPKTGEQSRVHITVSRSLLRKLEAARDALSHSKPGASEAEILEAGLDLLLERHARRKGLVKKPRKAPVAPRQARGERASRYIPAHVRREVWKRDQGRCRFPLESGGVCGSTYQVELDHIIPVAKGGPSTAKNVRCACKAHNLHAAREAFGDAWMDRYTRGRPLEAAAASGIE